MLATGTHDGVLKIWTAEVPPRSECLIDSYIQSPSRSSSPEPMFSDEERVETPTPDENKLSEKGGLKLRLNNLPTHANEKDTPISPTQEHSSREKRPRTGLNRFRNSYFGGKKKEGAVVHETTRINGDG
jgi:hypothetical protein